MELPMIVTAMRMQPTTGKGFLVVYSKCGRLPLSMLPDEGQFSDALGSRNKAHFICDIQMGKINIVKEIELGVAK